MGSEHWTVVSEEKNGKRITLRRPDTVGADADHRDRRRGKRKEAHDPSATLRINVSCPYGRRGNGNGAHGGLGLFGDAGRIKDGVVGRIWGGGAGAGCVIGENGGCFEHFVPNLVFVMEGVFPFDAREGVEH